MRVRLAHKYQSGSCAFPHRRPRAEGAAGIGSVLISTHVVKPKCRVGDWHTCEWRCIRCSNTRYMGVGGVAYRTTGAKAWGVLSLECVCHNRATISRLSELAKGRRFESCSALMRQPGAAQSD
jgi:hypothetical protein